MNRLLVSSACAAFLLAPSMFATLAQAQSLGEKTGVNSTLGVAPTTQDFVTEAANSDILELAAAQIATNKGNADEQKFAKQMTTDHTQTSKDIKAMIDGGDVKATIPVQLDSSGQKKLDELRDAKPEDFSGYYDPMQVSAHKDAVSLFERYARSGDNSKLKDWAGKTLPTLQHHLEMAENLNKKRD